MPDPPVNSVKNAQSVAAATAVPPGAHPNKCPQRAQQPLGRSSLGEQEPCEREQRNGREARGGRQFLVRVEQHHERRAAQREEEKDRQTAQQRENRHAERPGEKQQDHPRPRRPALEQRRVCWQTQAPARIPERGERPAAASPRRRATSGAAR